MWYLNEMTVLGFEILGIYEDDLRLMHRYKGKFEGYARKIGFIWNDISRYFFLFAKLCCSKLLISYPKINDQLKKILHSDG